MKHKISCPACKSYNVFAMYDESINVNLKRFLCEDCYLWFDIKNFSMRKGKFIFIEKMIHKNKSGKKTYIKINKKLTNL